MSTLRVRIVYGRADIAARVQHLLHEQRLLIESSQAASDPGAFDGLDAVDLLVWEQDGPTEISLPRVYSIAGANPDLLIVVLVPGARAEHDRPLLRNGAFDVLDDGRDLETDLAHTIAAARRVVALQEERAHLNSELAHQDKLSALGVLSAGVSHEINNPCSAILSNMTVVRDQLEALLARPRFKRQELLEERASDWIEAIGDCISAANRIHAIVKTLNVFSRKSESAPPVAVDVNEDVRTVLRLIGKEVSFQAHLEPDLAPGLPRIVAPPNSVTQIVTNLVVNALQALESTTVEDPQVTISTSFDDEHVMLEVGDNGPGMTADVAARIFDPFFTTKPIGKGTGLGLSITQQLVHRIGGEIFVESEPGQGARFSVVIERRPVFEEMARSEQRVPPQSDRLRVLLLDDDELILRSMQRSLSQHFECQAISRAQTALTVLEHDEEFDVVVSDVVMPEMNGLEFFTALAKEHPDLAARTVFISGGITSEVLHTRVTDTGRPCLAKPVDVQELVRTIRRLGRPFEELGR